jgi:hypothetical protein
MKLGFTTCLFTKRKQRNTRISGIIAKLFRIKAKIVSFA